MGVMPNTCSLADERSYNMLGPIEIIFLLAAWALPIAVLVWFVRAVNSIRESLRRIELRLESIDRGQLL
jgi:hypothetical protein